MKSVIIPTVVSKSFKPSESVRVWSDGDGDIHFGTVELEVVEKLQCEAFSGKLDKGWSLKSKAGIECEIEELDIYAKPTMAEVIHEAEVVASDIAWVAKASDVSGGLEGVAFTGSGAMVATDCRRMHICGEWHNPDVVGIIPSYAIRAVAKIAKKSEVIKITFSHDCAMIELRNAKLLCRLCDNRFPQWQEVCPKCTESETFAMPSKQDVIVAKAVVAGDEDATPTSELGGVKFDIRLLADIGGSGVRKWGDKDGPHFFDIGNDRCAIVMPLK